jgi:hypothetical protein
VNIEGNNNKKKGRHIWKKEQIYGRQMGQQLKKKSQLEKLPHPLPRLHRKNHSENSKH